MRLIGLLNYIYTLKMKTLTLLFSLFLMCPLSVWGQSADELLSKVSDALSEGKDDYAVSLFRQAANAGEDRTEMFYWTNVDKSSEVAPRLADVLAVHYKEMRNYDKAYLFYKELRAPFVLGYAYHMVVGQPFTDTQMFYGIWLRG